MKSLGSWLWLITAVLLLAALMRIYHLNEQGLWGDEGWSVEFSEPRTPAAVARNLIEDLHPPLYFIGLGAWRELAGSTEVAMRIVAVWSGLVTVALIYRIGLHLFDRASGLTAAMLLAIADKHIVLSQEVRHYPTAFMWMAASSLVYLRWIQKPTRRLTLIYAVLIMVSLYTHYYTALIYLVQLVYALFFLRPWQRVFKLTLLIGLSSLAFLPWIPVAIYQLQIRPEGILHSAPLSWQTLETFAIDYLGQPITLFIALLLIGIFPVKQWRPRHHPHIWFAIFWLMIPLALTVAIYDYVTLLTDRNMALLILPLALLVGHGVTAFRSGAQILLAGLLLINGLTSLDSYFVHPPWRPMAHYVASNYLPGEPVLMDVRGGDKALGYHLRQELPPDTRIISLNQWRLDYEVYFLGPLSTLLEENTGFWVAYWGDPDYEMDAIYQDYGYQRTATFRSYHLGNPIEWYHYDKLPSLDDEMAQFGDHIHLHQFKVPAEVKQGETLSVGLWWSTDSSLDISYSISVFLLNADGRLVAQHDGPPQSGASPTNTWVPETIVFDLHDISIDLAPGVYDVAVKVYNSANNIVLTVQSDEIKNHEYLVMKSIHVQ